METKIKLIPYTGIKEQVYSGSKIILIENSIFKGDKFSGEKITFHFFNCIFEKLTIENLENIEFEEVSIHFFGCYIKEIEISKIESENISIYFSSNIFSGKIDNKNINTLKINNSFFENSIFLSNIKKLELSYTEENIFPKVWNYLLKKIRLSSGNLLNIKQSIHIFDPLKASIYFNENKKEKPGIYKRHFEKLKYLKTGYRLKSEEKNCININISITNSLTTPTEMIKIINVKLKSLSLSGNFNGKTIIENTIIDSLYISEFKSELGSDFYNIFPSKEYNTPQN